jgi:integrase
LAERDLINWRDGLPKTLKATTRQRLMNDLRSALNGAYAAHRARLDATFPEIVNHGLKSIPHDDDEAAPVARDNQILTDAQVGTLISAARIIDAEQEWEGDLFRLVVVLAATGARFSQVTRMRVGDVQRERGRLMVPASRKGKGKKATSIPVQVGQDVLDALQPAVTGRKPDAFLLEKWWHKKDKGAIRWRRDRRGPWIYAAELAREWPAIQERARMPGVIPYAMRHSSIVRGIRANLPIRLVAAGHDTSAEMIERHYAKWIATGLEELAARAVVPLVPDERGANVIELARK